MSRFDILNTYEKWWLGKKVRTHSGNEWKRVKSIDFQAPPSGFYGTVLLTYEDGTRENVYCGEAFRPRKSDVEVLKESK